MAKPGIAPSRLNPTQSTIARTLTDEFSDAPPAHAGGFCWRSRVASFTLARPVDRLRQPIREIRQGQVCDRSILPRAHSAVSVAAISGLIEALP